MNQWIKSQADRLTEIFRLRTKKLMKERTKNKTRSVPNFKSAFEVVEKWVFLSISPTLCLVSLHYRCCGCGSEPAPPSWSLISAWAEGSQPRRERFASLRRPPSASCPILRSSCICTELLKITNQSSREGTPQEVPQALLIFINLHSDLTSKHNYEIVHFSKQPRRPGLRIWS